jgi:hypothetical protein
MVFGVAGLIVVTIGFGATLWVNGRISYVRGNTEANVARLATTLELAASALHSASTTAESFSRTADETAQAVSSAAVTATELHSDLSALEAQLRSVTFLGAAPLSSSADAVGRIAASTNGLDTQLSLVADGLTGNRDALAGNATSLGALADSTKSLAGRLGPILGQDPLDTVQQVVAITLLLFSAWSLVPAVGALVLGAWLRRELGRSPSR